MILVLAIIIFVIGCCLESYEDNTYRTQRREEKRHRELMKALDEARKDSYTSTGRRTKQVRRRFAQDSNGNLLGEEIIEEELEDDY